MRHIARATAPGAAASLLALPLPGKDSATAESAPPRSPSPQGA
ncbi:hypothetical protein [Streptomyces sp. NPDC023327]